MLLTRRRAVRWMGMAALAPGLRGAAAARALAAKKLPYQDVSLPVEARVRDLLGRMTVEEKARQLDMYAGVTPDTQKATVSSVGIIKTTGFKPADAQALWGNLGVGSIHDLHPPPKLYNTIQRWIIENTRLGIPALFLEEGLHGYFDGTVFPSPINLSATWNPELARRTGAAVAAEARANGVAMVLDPVLDVARDPRWGRVEEGFGEDPYLCGVFGLAVTQGNQGESLNTDHTVISEPKHFVGHGSPESGTNTSPVHAGEREVRTIMLKSFEPAIRQGHAMGVMAAYHDIDGIPMTANKHLLTDVLRGEWGYQGFVLSDLGAIRRLTAKHFTAATPKDAVCIAINAGMDMQFYDYEHDVFQPAVIAGAADGSLSREALDRAVSAVLRVKFLLGLFDRPFVDTALTGRVNRTQAHLDLSLESARQSMTLLKNDGGLLPLSKSLKNIALIGPNADAARYGDYSDEAKGARVSMLTGLRKLLPNANITFDEGKDVARAVELARSADVVIAGMGERRGISGESHDREDLNLPEQQQPLLEALVKTGKPVVLVLQNGRPLTLTWAQEHVPAILEAWYPAEFGGYAMAETLLGDHNPAGRLTITFPRSVGQLPDYYSYHPSRKLDYVEGDGTPLYPFGHGLSYTTFAYDALRTEPSATGVTVHVRVKNTGKVDGDEVAQMYFRETVTSVVTPVKQLAGFLRFHLRAGESRELSFPLTREQVRVWNGEGRWAFEPGEFTVWVGGSSVAPLSTVFKMTA